MSDRQKEEEKRRTETKEHRKNIEWNTVKIKKENLYICSKFVACFAIIGTKSIKF